MTRTTISVDDEIAALASRICEKENRNFSNLCEVALQQYCEPRVQDASHDEVIAAAKEIGVDKAVVVLRRAARAAR